MMKRIKPYLGITGCRTVEEVEKTLALFERYGFTMDSPHVPMLGVLVSYKTLIYGRHPTNPRYPPIERVPLLLRKMHGRCFATIHFNTRAISFSREVSEMLRLGLGKFCGGVQLNIKSPEPKELEALKGEFPTIPLILQLNPSFNLHQSEARIRMNVVPAYRPANYVLVDPSMGTGRDIDLNFAASVYRALEHAFLVGFAGGFNHKNVGFRLSALAKLVGTSHFSIDAESGLRTNDEYDLKKVETYIKSASRIIGWAE
jgi:phosphoribosylanthranilate isomerase